uniref:folate gamma-glutamyl hydrolase n=1 Tax=Glossina brevipalpis TaxID=37001 RepID=A0A1A9X0N1_9MUSC
MINNNKSLVTYEKDKDKYKPNFSPLIGVLCMDIAAELQQKYGTDIRSYISAAYVKYLESMGARVVPIWINRPRKYYEEIMKKVNGILFPGGAVFLDDQKCTENLRNDCVQSSKFIYEIAEEMNIRGEYFPLWGTCLGFQLMLLHSVKGNSNDIRIECQRMKCSLPINFENDEVLKNSQLFKGCNKQLITAMSQLPFGYHNHHYCLTKKILSDFNIADQWTVLGTNKDSENSEALEFITIVEHKKYPFFGSQIHPEQIFYEYIDDDGVDKCFHSFSCLELTQYFSKFFVQCAHQNVTRCNKDEAMRYLIDNFPIKFTMRDTSRRQCYLFKDNVDYPT